MLLYVVNILPQVTGRKEMKTEQAHLRNLKSQHSWRFLFSAPVPSGPYSLKSLLTFQENSYYSFLLCRFDSVFILAPHKFRSIHPHAMHNHGQLASHSDTGVLHG